MPRLRLLVLPVLLLVALLAPSTASAQLISLPGLPDLPTSTCSGATRTLQSAGSSATATSIRCLVNATRRVAGLGSVRTHRRLTLAARRHTRSMVSRGVLAHDIGSSTPTRRIKRAGYLRGCRSWGIGETLFEASGGLATPATVLEGWMNSPPHRAVLMTGAYRHLGLGIADRTTGGRQGMTVTANFGYCRR